MVVALESSSLQRAARRDRAPGRRPAPHDVRDDRLPAAAREPARDPHRGGRARRSGAGPGRPRRRRRADRRRRRPPAGDPSLGARRPGPARAVRDRGRGVDPQRPALREGRGPEPAPRRARRGQGRLPARRLAQPPDAAREHPRLRAAARHRHAGPAPRDHHRAGGPAVADGPPAADGQPDRVGRAAAARSRSFSPAARVRRTWEALGVDGRAVHDRRPVGRLARARRRRPARPGAVGADRQRGRVRRPHGDRRLAHASTPEAGDLSITIADHGAGVADEDRDRLFLRFERGTRAAGRRGQRPRASTSRASCAGR